MKKGRQKRLPFGNVTLHPNQRVLRKLVPCAKNAEMRGSVTLHPSQRVLRKSDAVREKRRDASKTRRVEQLEGSVLTVRDQEPRKSDAVLRRIYAFFTPCEEQPQGLSSPPPLQESSR